MQNRVRQFSFYKKSGLDHRFLRSCDTFPHFPYVSFMSMRRCTPFGEDSEVQRSSKAEENAQAATDEGRESGEVRRQMKEKRAREAGIQDVKTALRRSGARFSVLKRGRGKDQNGMHSSASGAVTSASSASSEMKSGSVSSEATETKSFAKVRALPRASSRSSGWS